ncbi:hypothetical protein ACFOOM_13990 [Streptomyces echinoruber]|uniref:Uncharacterized protein n=1 Tax=Streptomyces echinoruber TaxID=68898 RepID=A0A918RDQ6_9ACTN|nr:hypothetical protein [Streptomyces echinoruber]GGZ95018.1 hypothetical protein GCM10010389_37400 [Streptomyces echinoruber]
MPIEQYQAAHGCTCGHSHGQAPVQQIIIKQSDPWLRYISIGFAAATIGLLVLAGVVAALIAAGACALCVAVAVKALCGLFSGKEPKK